MAFGDQFESGQRFAQGLIDTYRTSKRRRQLGEIQNAQVEELPQQYTVQDGEQLRALATARKPDGTPYYTLTPGEDGVSYQVQPNFGVEQEGQMVNPGATALAPRQQHRFLGQTFDQAPTGVQMDRARLRAMAGVVGEDDPVRAAALLASMREEDRSDQRLGLAVRGDQREQVAFDATQGDRAERKGIEKARREFVKGLQAMPEDELAEQLGGAFSADGSGVDAMLTYDPSSNKFIFASKIPGMPSTTMSKAEAINHAAGLWEMGNGDFGAGLKMMMDGLREQRRMGERQQDIGMRTAEMQANQDYRGESLGLRREEMGANRADRKAARSEAREDRRLAREERAADRDSRAAGVRAQNTQYMEDESGNLVAVTPTVDKQGNVSYNTAPVGKGLRKPGGGPKNIEQEWQQIEKGLGNMPAEEVRNRREEFLSSRGVAPPSALSIIRSPTNPATGKPWTREDYESFNRRFPKSKVTVPGNGATGSY